MEHPWVSRFIPARRYFNARCLYNFETRGKKNKINGKQFTLHYH